MYGLCDCNNFYASCERVFRPDLVGRPVVVLSNNDGCIIARSNEAKALGIGMGQPFYQIRPLIDRGLVTVFSANFALYGDLSRRVMATLRSLVPGIEVYSIDEAFFDLRGMAEPLDELGRSINFFFADFINCSCIFGKMRECNCRTESRKVDCVLLVINSVLVCRVFDRGTLISAVAVFTGDVVNRENTVLCASLNCHVCNAKSVINVEVFKTFAREFH